MTCIPKLRDEKSGIRSGARANSAIPATSGEPGVLDLAEQYFPRADPVPKILKILHICETAMGGVGVYQKNLAEMPENDVDQTFLMPESDARIMEGDPRVVTFPKRSRGFGTILLHVPRQHPWDI